jgi:hypothetical protein
MSLAHSHLAQSETPRSTGRYSPHMHLARPRFSLVLLVEKFYSIYLLSLSPFDLPLLLLLQPRCSPPLSRSAAHARWPFPLS